MRTRTRALLVAVAVAAATHVALLVAIPRLVMNEVMRVAAVRAGGVNRIDFAARVTDRNQIVVRASPDFFYASCAYDLAAGPLAITTPAVPGTRSVVALFSENMDNFFVGGDWQGQSPSVVVAQAGQHPASSLPVITSPTRRGLALVRVLVNDERAAAAIDAARRAGTCASLAPSVEGAAAVVGSPLRLSVANPTQSDADVTPRRLLDWPGVTRLVCLMCGFG